MIREPEFCQFALHHLLPFAEQFPIQYFNGKKNYQIAYRHFKHSDIVAKKLVILVNGRAENLLKWTEVAYDFYEKGYDVLVFDHRGQGYSQRLLKDLQKGYIDEFRFYVDDIAMLIELVTTKYAYEQQYLLAHSLGALISTYYLANYDHYIKRAVFSSPFWGLPTEHPIRDELIINLMMILGQGSRYVFGKSAYKPADLRENELSFCKTRMKWMNRINAAYPQLHLGGPTFRWVHLCLQAIKGLDKVLPRIEIPILILRSEKEKIVNNKNLENLTALLEKGTLETVNNAKHEILFERDPIRYNALQSIFKFMAKD
ncbi:lysophospholipase [Bisgaardia hudsonensis]|uniref:Lysophospholipase n=1 Tax=Bisgaardia hudsonensis TaxID=109472 RepID=A0A4R2MUE9_9PAST|nr:alpha/beta hydrolase [Bisgaardia hudsonensis]QLB12256.1 hydrolase [Bisgaardia hudsonensis]TCP12300.1 lysophospholipase [Bisgaardia hudsonensis]